MNEIVVIADAAVEAAPPLPVISRRQARRRLIWAGIFVAVAGAAIRVGLILPDRLGLLDDTDFFLRWTRDLHALGLKEFYAKTAFCDYPPLFVLIMRGLGALADALHFLQSDHAMRVLLKIPACLADAGIAVLLYTQGKRWFSPHLALGAAALYWLNPVSFYNSAYWGQVDSIHTLLLLAALAYLTRSRFLPAGALAGLALLQKFQSIALWPLFLFEAYRLRGWRGLFVVAISALLVAVVVLAPFATAGVADDVVQRAYLHVVGQYSKLTPSAFNIWQLHSAPDATDTSPPHFLIRVLARGAPVLHADNILLRFVTWRNVSLALFALAIALTLTLYSYHPGGAARYGAAASLALAFFLFPTEMHERYAHPAMAFGAIWAVTGRWKERAYFLLSALLVLNLAHILPPAAIAAHIGVMIAALFIAGLVAQAAPYTQIDRSEASEIVPLTDQPGPARSLIRIFRGMTYASFVLAFAAVGTGIAINAIHRPSAADERVRYLSSLEPITVRQGWGKLQRNASVLGGAMHLGDDIHLYGLGTHAPSTLVYDIPPGYEVFRARVGIDRDARSSGSAVAIVQLDGATQFTSDTLRGDGSSIEVSVPLQGAKRITLRTQSTNDGAFSDHVDWASARFER
jgi:Gpi18-like mannosyltransferase